MKKWRYIWLAVWAGACLVLAAAGDIGLDPGMDLALRLFLTGAPVAWWAVSRRPACPMVEASQRQGTAIDARELMRGIEEAREDLVSRRPSPDRVQHYRRTLLVMAHQAVAETNYFKHREPLAEEQHAPV